MTRRAWILTGALLGAVAVSSGTPFGPGAARAGTLALVGGTVHTVTGPTIENATVVIVDGKIAAVGADVRVPAGAEVVSVAGKQVYPGFVAPYTVLGLTEITSVQGSNDYAETGEVNPNIRAEVEVNPESELIPVARDNGITSALIVPQGGVLSGTSALMHLDGWTREDMTVRAPVALHIHWPSMTPQRGYYVRQPQASVRRCPRLLDRPRRRGRGGDPAPRSRREVGRDGPGAEGRDPGDDPRPVALADACRAPVRRRAEADEADLRGRR
jgi:hypothetical protein